MTPVQLPIDFGHRPAFAAADFLVAPCNAAAHARLLGWPDWRTLALTGPAGSGKSHLAHLFAERNGAVLVSAAGLSLADPPRLADAGVVVVEDADRAAAERPLLHLFNLLAQNGGSLLVTGREPPSRWPIALPDLASRLAALPLTSIDAPDDALLRALLVKLFADRQLRVGEEALVYLALRMERSFDAARALVAAIDAASLAGQRAVSVPLVRAVLASLPVSASEEISHG